MNGKTITYFLIFLITFEGFLFFLFNNIANMDVTSEKLKAFMLVFIIINIFVMFIMFVYFKKTVDLTEEKSEKKEIDLNKEISKYVDIIGSTSIVSRGDLDGKITYVNQAFKDISGYEEEELLGSPHSIIRSPNVSSEVFENMWIDLKNGKEWRGILECKSKSGKLFLTDTLIVPMRNCNEEIEQYLSVRSDMTPLFDLNKKLEASQLQILDKLAIMGEMKSKETQNHVKRVEEITKIFCKNLGMKDNEIEKVAKASALHDIGKIAINDNILNKNGKLTDEEFDHMKSHTTLGHEILKDSSDEVVQLGAIIAYEHHEQWSGKGYPRGIKGTEISLEARVVTVVDVFDSLINERVYKPAWELDRVISYFEEESGNRFDPHIVYLLKENIDDILKIEEKYKG